MIETGMEQLVGCGLMVLMMQLAVYSANFGKLLEFMLSHK